ncbi:hypothetical protein TTHERM_00013080 (macronuclear) [Tetrahymena thermophila SB210]|uniref:Uncharacterized protein n=1 Tax=Tetrahymena thermophila (strain SB210) TaxID=312017 RepID=Q22RS9_TETTS|nr:hypothetical protein TTHERM_00013080 [Tetrahymena thermophila SB210]EAR88043.3 hypothetical protein TTHERM_00013080 [Tetrahymena thermophila SB210]|eukprot:XP_001008288.3 hypothetical protein TTHERM_00013080 [Tetrahymena thermophila SB210]
MQNNSQLSQQRQGSEREQPQNNLPSNFPRFSVQIPSPSKQNSSSTKIQKKNENFTGFLNKKMDSTTTKQDEDSISMISGIPQWEESQLNETINKELHKERSLVLQYVNQSLNDHTNYIKELGKEIKDQQYRNKELNDKQSLMMRNQISEIEQNFRLELEQMNQKFTKMIHEQKHTIENQLYEKENRIYDYCNELEQRLEVKITSLNQRLQLQLDMKDNKLNEGQALKKLDSDIQNINNKIQQIQKLQNLDDLTGFNSQLATFSQEIQQIKQQLRKNKEDLDSKIIEMNQNTVQFLKNSLNQNSNNLISNQNYKDKIFEGQIEEIQRYISGFSKAVQNRLNITNQDLNLFLDSDGNGSSQKQTGQKNPFSFGGGINMQNAERVSTLGTMQSAEFEVKDNNKIILKKDQNSFPSTPNPNQQKNPSYKQQQQVNYQNLNNTGRMSYSPSRHTNLSSNDYYNIFQESAPSLPYTPSTHNDSSYQSQQQQQQQVQKKKKKIFGEDPHPLPPIAHNNYLQQPPVRQTRNIDPSPTRNQVSSKPEQKAIFDSQAPQSEQMLTQKTESDQVEFATMPNKESFQSQQGYYSIPQPILDSKLSVKVNENVEVYNDNNQMSDSDSEEEQSNISNFRLKDTMDFMQREVISQGQTIQSNQISPFQQQQQQQIQQQLYQNQYSQQQQQQNILQQDKLQTFQLQQQNLNSKTSPDSMNKNQINQQQQYNTNVSNQVVNNTNHKRLNTIQESDQEYSSKKEESKVIMREEFTQPVTNNYMINATEPQQISLNKQPKQNSYEDYESFKINMPKQELRYDNDTPSKNKTTPKHKITNEGFNFMVQSKGKSSFTQQIQGPSNLQGLIENDNDQNFKPKWGFDSQVSRSEGGEEIEYQLDDDGYLLDENGKFVLDDNGQKIQLTQDNINFLAQNKMIYDV